MTPEQKSRKKIDHQLGQCGWLVQDYRQMDLSAGLGVAVRKFPLETGHADYMLYVDRRAIGPLEAKRPDITDNGSRFPMKFPNTWPANCPPADADDADGDVFRLVKHDPPLAEDTASHMETGRLPKAPPCLRCGLSVFRELRDAVHQRQLLPKLGRLIAKATLLAEHGRTKLTEGRQPTHTTWWAYEGVNRAGLFSVVSEED